MGTLNLTEVAEVSEWGMLETVLYPLLKEFSLLKVLAVRMNLNLKL